MQITLDFNSNQIYNMLNWLDVNEKLNIVKKLEEDTFEYRLDKLRNSIPNSDITNEDIIKEVKKIINHGAYYGL